MDAHSASGPVIPPLTYLVIGALVIGRFLLRELRERKLVLARMFFIPILIGALALYLLVTTATLFPATDVLLTGEALVTLGIGLAVGLAVARFTRVRLGETPGTVYVLGSWATVAIWVAALLVRVIARFAIAQNDHIAQLSANAALVVMVAAALAMVRYRVLIDARELRARGITTSVPVL